MRTKLLLATLASGVMLTGCATGPNGGMNTSGIANNKAALGGLLGAVAGAGISKATGGEKTGRDAAIGAAVGAGVGYYMQRQEQILRQQTQGTGIQVSRDPNTNNINLVMPEAITFDKAQSDIKPRFYNTLDKVATTLSQYNQTTINVRGYASSEGDVNYNQRLSQARASSIGNYLMNRGVSGNRISAVGYGIANPIASNATEAGRMQNRRVEMTINAPQSVN